MTGGVAGEGRGGEGSGRGGEGRGVAGEGEECIRQKYKPSSL